MGPPPNKTQRRTLAERAGDVEKRATGPSNHKFGTAYYNATSLNGASRTTSLSSSVSSRPHSSASSRTVSNSSYSSSMGPGARPPSSASNRSISALNNHRLQRPTHGRSGNSLEPHYEEPLNGSVLGKRKGRTPFSFQPDACSEGIQTPRVRQNQTGISSPQRGLRKVVSLRDISIATQFNGLSLENEIVKLGPLIKSPSSCIPRAVPSPMKSVQSSPSKTPRRKKSQPVFPTYLSKETNVKSAFDIDQRWEEMESFRDQVTEHARANMEEHEEMKRVMGVYKTISGFLLALVTMKLTSDAKLVTLKRREMTSRLAIIRYTRT